MWRLPALLLCQQLVANGQVWFYFFPYFDIGHSNYDTMESGSGIVTQIIV